MQSTRLKLALFAQLWMMPVPEMKFKACCIPICAPPTSKAIPVDCCCEAVIAVRTASSVGMLVFDPGVPMVVTSVPVGLVFSALCKSDWFASVPVMPPHTGAKAAMADRTASSVGTLLFDPGLPTLVTSVATMRAVNALSRSVWLASVPVIDPHAPPPPPPPLCGPHAAVVELIAIGTHPALGVPLIVMPPHALALPELPVVFWFQVGASAVFSSPFESSPA